VLQQCSELVQDLHQHARALAAEQDRAEAAPELLERAHLYSRSVMPQLEELGRTCASLESVVDDAVWPLPKFTELLFTR
jgi:glutamine synthetase